jgi:uncharacterized membrane protein YraQ (UPF0718 family)
MKAFLNVGVILLIAIAVCFANYRIGGFQLVQAGLVGGLKMLGGISVLLVALGFLSGQIGAFYSKKPETVRSVISGEKGVIKAAFVGAILPGSMASGPVLRKEWNNGGSKYAILAFLMSATLISWSGLLIRIPFFGERISFIIYGISMTLMVAVGGGLFLLSKFKIL